MAVAAVDADKIGSSSHSFTGSVSTNLVLRPAKRESGRGQRYRVQSISASEYDDRTQGSYHTRTQRKPLSWLRFDGVLLLRYALRQ
jgi:hypothetical protein